MARVIIVTMITQRVEKEEEKMSEKEIIDVSAYTTKKWEHEAADGSYKMRTYQPFEGVWVSYLDVHTKNISFANGKDWPDHVFEITHCREGRIEDHVGEEFCYLTPGDLSISRANAICRECYFPFGHFHGITIQIDANMMPAHVAEFLETDQVNPHLLFKKFCGGSSHYVARSNSTVEHVFAELYSVNEAIQSGYIKTKVMELLLFLSTFDVSENELEERVYSHSQVTLAKSVAEYLMDKMHKKVTLEQLAKQFHVSGSHIKNCFKGVFGVSYYAYVKTQKMQSAAIMLEKTTKSILEIAGQHGYENSSKFATAFRSIMGVSPMEYRNGKISHL